MYKDFKKTESLDTGFVGGSGIVWMFSGIVIGLLVGLGMYYFSNLNTDNGLSVAEKTQASEQKIIKQRQLNQRSAPNQTAATSTSPSPGQASTQADSTQAPMENISILDEAKRDQQAEKKRSDTVFDYYALLPKLDVPVGSVKAIDVRDSARDSANIAQVNAVKKQLKPTASSKSKAKGKNKASEKKGKGKYFLQIASFKRKSSANVALRALSKRGVKANIYKKKIKGRLWYRITVGSLNKATAYSWKKKAEKLGHKPRLIRPKK